MTDTLTSIKPFVDAAMAHKFRLALVNPKTQKAIEGAEREAFLTRAFLEIAKGMGVDRMAQTPAERLDQFAVMSVLKNHDTAGLLRSLVNSFMIAYACPETSDRAFAALVQIEGLRAEVAHAKGQGLSSNKPELIEAAAKLDAMLVPIAGEAHTKETPVFIIMAGADRLFVHSICVLPGVPTILDGLPIEYTILPYFRH